MLSEEKKQFSKIIDWLKDEFKTVQVGVANPSMLDGVYIDAYGSQTQLSNVASVTMEDPRTLRVSPWDKGHTKLIEASIKEAGLPFSVVSDSNGLRVIVPQTTEETRKKVLKVAGALHEEARVKVRKLRQSVNDTIDAQMKSKELTEDEAKQTRQDVQKIVDDTNHELDRLSSDKEKSLMTI